jgi:DNA-binding SARP family transcriptional activator
MLPPLVHFLNHGTLPFVGRGEELRQIEEFWRMTSESHGLRSMLLIGEAGVGKSRLVEESIGSIRAAGGTVIHAKLYPDSANAIAPLLARAIGRSAEVQPLLKSMPEETVSGVSSAMVRVCSLRPTIMIIEDIHLLSGDALQQLARILDWLCDEPLSLLLTARPVEIAARSVIERFIVHMIMLPGLQQGDIDRLCREVFGDRIDSGIVGVLEQKTQGNALALRSALRGAISSGALVPADPGAGGRGATVVKVDQAAFASALERNVRLLSEGMVAHLSEQEKEAAGRLASLGEVVSRDTAIAILTAAGAGTDEAIRLLDQLTFKGIITTSAIRPLALGDEPVIGASFSFTHSLLHRHLLASNRHDPALIVAILASDLPIYSVVPFEQIGTERPGLSPDQIKGAIVRAIAATSKLDLSTDWQLSRSTHRAARALLESSRDLFTEEERLLLDATVTNSEMFLHRRSNNYEQRRAIAARLLEISAHDLDALLFYRLNALKWISWSESHIDIEACNRHRAEMRALVEEHPHLKLEYVYLNAIRERAVNVIGQGVGPLRQIERELDEILAIEGASESIRNYAIGIIGPYLLECFDSEEELRRREELLAELERLDETAPSDQHLYLLHNRIFFLLTIGRLDDTIQAIEDALPTFRSHGYWIYAAHGNIILRYIDIIRGGDLSRLPQWVAEFRRTLPDPDDPWTTTDIVTGLIRPLMLRDEPGVAREVMAAAPHHLSNLDPADHLLLALASNDLTPLLQRLDEPQMPPVLRSLLLAASGSDATDPEILESKLRVALERPILCDTDIVHARALVEMIDRLDGRYDQLRERSAEAAADLLKRALEWLADRALPAPMDAILARYGGRLDEGTVSAWKGRAEALRKVGQKEQSGGEGRIRLTMFGSILIQRPGQEPERVRGAQLCTLLGLMVADQMQETPFSQREFLALTIGSDRDPENARKSFNFAVFRLREMLGNPRAIDTSAETPRLSTDLVEVDLLEAAAAMRRAQEALGIGALMRAVPELLATLRIGAGEVVYPTLYQEFFEGGREDYESALRTLVISVTRGLIREQDHTSAEEILMRAHDAMPDDAEIGELLQHVLVAQGKRARAARMRRVGEGERG